MKKQNLGFLAVGLVVELLIGGVYSQQSAIAANGEGHGKLVNGWSDPHQAYVFRMWQNGTVEYRRSYQAGQWTMLP